MDGQWGDPFDAAPGRYARGRDIEAEQRHASLSGAAVPRPDNNALLACYAIVPEADLIERAAREPDEVVAEALRKMAGYGGLGRHTA